LPPWSGSTSGHRSRAVKGGTLPDWAKDFDTATLVGGNEQVRWNSQAKRLRRFEIDGCLELSRRLHREVVTGTEELTLH
jgi:hypothetical protein